MHKIHFSSLAALLMVAIVAGSAIGCARNNRTTQSATTENVRDKLSKVPLSGSLVLRELSDTCDEAAATKSFFAQYPLDQKNVAEIWNTCQDLYQCSPTTSAALKQWFAGGKTFRVGFSDLKALNTPKLGSKVGALYISSSGKTAGNIYIDTAPKTTRKVCAYLYHELVHRFDPDAQNVDGTLATEFRAYWHQFTFQDELFLDQGELGKTIREKAVAIYKEDGPDGEGANSDGTARRIVTREALHDAIAKIYGFDPNPSIIDRYPMLPLEQRMNESKKAK